MSILWDKTGQKYGRGAGLRVIVNGQELASSPTLGKLTATMPPLPAVSALRRRPLNYAVNNDGARFPRAIASHTSDVSDLSKLNDGQYWYHIAPPNRWTAEGSPNATDWTGIDFGIARPIHTVKLYFLDDGKTVVPPQKVTLEHRVNGAWQPIPGASVGSPGGRRATTVRFPMLNAEAIRAVLTHAPSGRSGLSEFEAWGDGDLPVKPAPAPQGNLALNDGAHPFPKATASFTSPYDKPAEAIDGRIVFAPTPRNRWTSYESPNKTDWLEIDLGAEKTIARVSLHLYDDRGGVQAPASYTIQYWDGSAFKDCDRQVKSPPRPVGGTLNEVTFTPVKTQKLRAVFTHKNNAKSGVTEIEIWSD